MKAPIDVAREMATKHPGELDAETLHKLEALTATLTGGGGGQGEGQVDPASGGSAVREAAASKDEL